MCEQRDGTAPKVPVIVVESHAQAERQVSSPLLHIIDDLPLRLEFDDIRDIEFFHQHPDQIDTEAFRLVFVVEKGVRPQMTIVHIDEGMLFCIDSYTIRLGCGRWKRKAEGQKQ